MILRRRRIVDADRTGIVDIGQAHLQAEFGEVEASRDIVDHPDVNGLGIVSITKGVAIDLGSTVQGIGMGQEEARGPVWLSPGQDIVCLGQARSRPLEKNNEKDNT